MPGVAGHLASNFTVTTSFVTFMSTSSLGVGTWVVDMGAIASVTSLNEVTIQMVAGTATATFEGGLANGVTVSGFNTELPLGLSAIVTVTVAGTIAFQAKAANTGDTIRSSPLGSGLQPATGWTACQT